MGRHEAKKNDSKQLPDKILLAAAILELLNRVMEIIKTLTD